MFRYLIKRLKCISKVLLETYKLFYISNYGVVYLQVEVFYHVNS